MNPPMKYLQLLAWFTLTSFSNSIVSTPTLRALQRNIQPKQNNATSNSSLVKDLKILYYAQTLDHFNYKPESYTKFKQKFMVYSKHWGGAKINAPIFVYLGDESPMFDGEIDWLVLPEFAAKSNALVVIIEHRFYGDSVPFGLSMEEVLKNATIRGYFNSAQALADYAEIILHVKNKLKAHYSPVIVFGGSYGGMLASWFRLKYPHIALGALASSAPVLYFDNMIPQNHGYYYVVNKDFKQTSESCYETIKNSWVEIDKVGSKMKGTLVLSKKFKTCSILKSTHELKDFLETMYDTAAQYYDASMVCRGMDSALNQTDILSRIYAGVVSFYSDNHECLETSYQDETTTGYDWQTCSEMVMPVVRGTSNESMFPPETFKLHQFIQKCKHKYHVMPRPHWITSYYGGHDMKLILKRFGSNIIFSNGLKDPYSSAGVLQNLSDTIVAIYTKKGSHCEDIFPPKKNDPHWLIEQRIIEFNIIMQWIKTYYEDLAKYLAQH